MLDKEKFPYYTTHNLKVKATGRGKLRGNMDTLSREPSEAEPES